MKENVIRVLFGSTAWHNELIQILLTTNRLNEGFSKLMNDNLQQQPRMSAVYLIYNVDCKCYVLDIDLDILYTLFM